MMGGRYTLQGTTGNVCACVCGHVCMSDCELFLAAERRPYKITLNSLEIDPRLTPAAEEDSGDGSA